MPTQNVTDEIKKHAAWSIFMGVVTAALGIFLIIYPLETATITTVLLGWVLIFVGLAQFVFALHSRTVGNFVLKVLLAALYGIIGVGLAFFTFKGVVVLTGLLGTLLLVQAGLLTVAAFQAKPLDGWGWYLADAAASLVLGVLIFLKWPSSSVWAIGTIVGVAVLVGGISRIVIASKAWSGASSVEHAVQRAA